QTQGSRGAQGARRTTRAVLDDEDRRQAVAIPGVEAAGHQFEVLDGFGVEGAGQAEEPIRVVNLDPVHHGKVLVGAAAPNAEAAVEVVDRAYTRQRLEYTVDVLASARDALDDGRIDVDAGWRSFRRRLVRTDGDHLADAGDPQFEQHVPRRAG